MAPAAAAADRDAGYRASGDGLSAVVRYTEYGVPHIVAKDYAGLGFGTGWAQAADQVCVLADGFLTVRGERSRYLGAAGAPDGSLSSARTNLASDLYFRGVREAGTVERLLAAPAPAGPGREVRELMRGWAAGYNAWLKRNKVTDPACAGAGWVRPVTALDVARRHFALAVLAGEGGAVDAVTDARPPGAASVAPADPDRTAKAARALTPAGSTDMGSNAVAFSGATTRTGRGLLLGNPHYPWHGGRRFWQVQQTIPGVLNTSGATLLGGVVVTIGFTEKVAWSHTVATGVPFSLRQLTLDPADPTVYLVDGRPERMTRRTVTVPVKDGAPVTRTQWWTRYGPVVTALGSAPLPWSAAAAYALSDPNTGNLRLPDTGLGFARARSTAGMLAVLRRVQGLPWVNTIAADAAGHTLFTQSQVLPRITDELAERCSTPLGRVVYPASGLAVLDGSRAACSPGSDPDAVQPGVFGPSRMPVLRDAPYAANSNDSAWLANADRPLTGYERVFGTVATERSLRTRGGIEDVSALAARGGLTVADLQRHQFANRATAGTLAAADAAKACPAVLPDAPEACAVLGRWDRTMRTSSRGALLFDRFWRRFAAGTASAGAPVWRVPFSAADPVRTPHTLNTASPAFGKALGDAVAELRAAGIPLDAPLGDHQYVVRGGKRIPVPGGTEALGVWNMTVPVWNAGAGGYTEVRHGTSHVQAVGWNGGRCPVARTLLTYSQSSNPLSPHYRDQTELYAAGRWVTARFCERDILADPHLRVVRVHG
ncbi:penicillin acylase family protein [Streptomyces sp. LP05-1]|uniref:Penicillin acylase family protein n=1 Tax=Streptomyces pyxinae TaxID=2970734 RepID=A0ABT2CH85_9ACTN|nr:penicillin acylase family protein [Streptomyces sp. LP05-1]MCS0636753.1 penicillin acylase family protein [Streptomyces sp. LP05-1]